MYRPAAVFLSPVSSTKIGEASVTSIKFLLREVGCGAPRRPIYLRAHLRRRCPLSLKFGGVYLSASPPTRLICATPGDPARDYTLAVYLPLKRLTDPSPHRQWTLRRYVALKPDGVAHIELRKTVGDDQRRRCVIGANVSLP